MTVTLESLAFVLGEIDLVHALALAGVPVAIINKPGALAGYSRSASEVQGWIDPWLSPTGLVERLKTWAADQPERPVLFYDGDWELLLVSRHRRELGELFSFVVPDAQLVEDTMDKERFQALARRLDLPVPKAVRLDGEGDWSVATGELTFPLVVKPLIRQHLTWKAITNSKAIRAETPQDLERLRRKLEASDIAVIAQEQVAGHENMVESYHAYIDDAGVVVGEFTGRKIRTFPATFGYSSALEITDAPDVVALGRSIVESIGLRGVVKLDLKRAPDGALLLLEVNPRFSLWHYPGARAGVNIPELVYRDLTGEPRRPQTKARAGVRWVSPYRDRIAARDEGITFRQWLPWVLRSQAIHGFRWNDPRLLLHAALMLSGRRSWPDSPTA